MAIFFKIEKSMLKVTFNKMKQMQEFFIMTKIKPKCVTYFELNKRVFLMSLSPDSDLCLVLLCDQNSFGQCIMVSVWPNWLGLDLNDLVTTKINWSGPNVTHFGRKSQFGPDQFILVMTISFWLWPNHYGQVQINLVRPKPFWTDQNCLVT